MTVAPDPSLLEQSTPAEAPNGPFQQPLESILHLPEGGPVEDVTLDTIADTVGYAASAIDGLRDVLERLNGSVARAQESWIETRLGQLFTRAQDYVDSALADAKRTSESIAADANADAARVRAEARDSAAALLGAARNDATKILDDARGAAAKTLDDARAEAARIVEEAERTATPSTEAIGQLESAIALFHRVNDELADGLTALHDALTVPPETPAAPETDSAVPAPSVPAAPMAPAPSVPAPPMRPAATEGEATPAGPTAPGVGPDLWHDEPDVRHDDAYRVAEELPAVAAAVAAALPDRRPSHDSPTADLSGAWMHDTSAPWDRPFEHDEPRRRFWRRRV